MVERLSEVAAASSAADRIRAIMGHQDRYSPRQEEILDALEAIFLERGLRKTTVGELAASARCSRKTLYDLAPTKEQMFLLVLDRMWRRLGERARDGLASAGDAAEQIETFLSEGITIFRPPWTTFIEDIEAYGPARRLFDDHVNIGLDFVADLIAKGIDEGTFRPVAPRLAAEVLGAAVTQVVYREHLDVTATSDAELVRQASDLVLRGLIAQPEAGSVTRGRAPRSSRKPRQQVRR